MILQPGDLLALSGDLGVGKSTFARGLIQHAMQDQNHEVSSPTYTLCNLYEGHLSIAHFDLYRLSSPDELEELGLDEALETGCALIEWPEKGFVTLPAAAVRMEIIEEDENSRTFVFTGNENLLLRIGRSLEIRRLLSESGLDHLTRFPLDGDASARRYEILSEGNEQKLLLMDSPVMTDGPPVKGGKPYSQIAHLAESVSAFVAIDKLLLSAGLAAPKIPAMDLKQGFLVVENLGAEKIIDANRQPIEDRYMAAAEFLADMHQQKLDSEIALPDGTAYRVPEYDHGAMTIEVELLLEWYMPEFSGKPVKDDARHAFYRIWDELIGIAHGQEQVLVLRDFHSPNIIWRGGEPGTRRIGVIDFQDAVIGPSAYDIASLAQDARVDVSRELEARLLEHYISRRLAEDQDFDESAFRMQYSIMSALRTTKILGIFVRLNKRDGKPQYLAHLPRMQDYLKRSLSHPVLEEYSDWLGTAIDL